MHSSLKDQMKEWKRQNPESIQKKSTSQKPQKRREEHLSESDIKSLMGMDRPTYIRHRGAFRQK